MKGKPEVPGRIVTLHPQSDLITRPTSISACPVHPACVLIRVEYNVNGSGVKKQFRMASHRKKYCTLITGLMD